MAEVIPFPSKQEEKREDPAGNGPAAEETTRENYGEETGESPKQGTKNSKVIQFPADPDNPGKALEQLADSESDAEHMSEDEIANVAIADTWGLRDEGEINDDEKLDAENIEKAFSGAEEMSPEDTPTPREAGDYLQRLILESPEDDVKKSLQDIQKTLEEIRSEGQSGNILDKLNTKVQRGQNMMAKAIVKLIRYGAPLGAFALVVPGGGVAIAVALASGVGIWTRGQTRSIQSRADSRQHHIDSLGRQDEALGVLVEGGKNIVSEANKKIEELFRTYNSLPEESAERKVLKEKIMEYLQGIEESLQQAKEQAITISDRVSKMKMEETAFSRGDMEAVRNIKEGSIKGAKTNIEWEKYLKEVEASGLSLTDYAEMQRTSSRSAKYDSLPDENRATQDALMEMAKDFPVRDSGEKDTTLPKAA
jgi:hypothetical protein